MNRSPDNRGRSTPEGLVYTLMLLAGAVAVSFSLLACSVSENARVPAAEAPAPVIRDGQLTPGIVLTGAIRAVDASTIKSPEGAWGISIRWMAKDGSTVKKGDKILEMDTTALVQEIDQLDNQVDSAASALTTQLNNSSINVADKQNILDQAKHSLDKAKLDASVPKESYPERTYQDMQAALRRAKTAYKNATEDLAATKKIEALTTNERREQLSKVKRQYELARKKLNDYIFYAPKDGVLVAGMSPREGRSLQVGDKTWPGMVVLEMPDMSKMKASAELSDVDDGRVHVGMRARCILDAFPETPLAGEVALLSPVAKAPEKRSLRRSFDVEVKLIDSPPEGVRPGMSARIELLDAPRDASVIAPRESLEFGVDGERRLLLADGKELVVKLGLCTASECEIVDSGNAALSPGTKLGRRTP